MRADGAMRARWRASKHGRPRRKAAKISSAANSCLPFEAMESRILLAGVDPVINEFLTNNKTGLAAADGSHPDWIEIYNPGVAVVNLGGWKITAKDAGGAASTFTIPTTNATATTIAASGFKIIFCDSQATPINAASEIHSNFNLDKSGGSIIFYKPDDTVVSSFDPYPEQASDVSYGPGPTSTTTTPLINTPAPTRILVPSGAGLGSTWTSLDGFDDSTWASGTSGLGFEVIPGGSNPPALTTETEPNDTAATANDATTNFAAQAASSIYHMGIKGNFSAGSDNDYYKIGAMQVGDILSLSVSGSPSSRGTNADPYVELFRGSNASSLILVTSNDEDGVGSDALIDRFSIAAADTYYVKAHSASNLTSGTYDLGIYLENTSTAPTTGGTTAAEPASSNDTGPTASDISRSWRRVQYLSHTTGSLGSGAATDMFKYKLTAGDLVTINLDSTATADVKVTLYNSAGTTVLGLEDGTSTRTSPYDKDSTLYSFIVPSTGNYYVKAQGSAAGAYGMDLYLSTTTAPPTPGSGVQPVYTGLINTDLAASMQNVNASVYLRVAFTAIDPSQVTSLVLSMKYEDGFVAYLNGQEVARSNAPGSAGTAPAYNAAAASDRTDSSATAFQDFDITAFQSALVPGSNLLAIQGLNNSAADGRFLIVPELKFTTVIQPGLQYFATPTPAAANAGGSVGSVKPVEFSADHGYYTTAFDASISETTSSATIRYTTDGTAPTASNGTVYTGPVHISATTVLRAAAFKPGYLASEVGTQTYLFLAGVQSQTVPSAGYPTASYPTTWAGDTTGGVPAGTYPADYNIDSRISTPTAGSSWTNADFIAGLTQIPTISIATDPANLFAAPVLVNNLITGGGIYQLPQMEGVAWEKAASIELINPDGSDGFQIDAGLRIQGAAARQNSKQPKHSFRILFKSDYGASTLDYPFYGPGSNGLDTIDLRGTYNNSWTHSTSVQRQEAEYIRDGWNRLTQRAMGNVGARQKFVQLYINGLYWGMYDAADRPESSFIATQLGGTADDYEVLNAGTPVDSPADNPNGAANDWATLNSKINQTVVVSGSTVPYVSTDEGYQDVKAWVDVKNLADYIAQMMFDGNQDWDANNHNWYAFRNGHIAGDGWKFIAWDSERTLEGTGDNITAINNTGAPSHIFQQLMTNADFKVLFADRVHRAFFNDGALTPAANAARYTAMSNQINKAIIDESARWGDYRVPVTPYTRDTWNTEVTRIVGSYFPVRTANVLAQFLAKGWYPVTDAAEYSQFGGTVATGFQLTINNSAKNITNGGGVIYYTTDGSDPRLPGGGVGLTAQIYDPAHPPALSTSARLQTRVLLNGVWSASTDATFIVGPPPALRVTEVMYHPANPPAGSIYAEGDFEFIELQNTGATPIALEGFVLGGGANFTFPKGLSNLLAGQYITVVKNLAAFQSLYGTSVPVAGVYFGSLSNSGDEITLASPLGQAIEDFIYADGWYANTDGDGYSLVAVDPNATNAALSAASGWHPSPLVNGAPGAADTGLPGGSVIINEVLSNATGIAGGEWIELRNTIASPIYLSYWYLSDQAANLKEFQIAPGTIIPAGGYLTFTQADFGAVLSLADAGGNVYLSQGDSAGNVLGYRDTEDFGAADPGVTHGRYVNSVGDVDFPQLAAPTFGAANSAPKVGPIVMTELMYHPSGSGDEFIELRNITSAAVNLYDPANPANTWQLTDGVTFVFPQGVSIPAYGFALVVPILPATYRTQYNIPAAIPIFGPYTGALSNGGEKVKLAKPGAPIAGIAPYITADRVTYGTSTPWPTSPDGAGPSLIKNVAAAYSNDPANWQASANGGTPGANNLPNTAPTISPLVDASINEGGTYSASGSFNDPDLDPDSSWTATVNYGDGGGVQPLALSGKTFSLSHVYADNPADPATSYTVTIVVSDLFSATGTASVQVAVANIAPTLSILGAATATTGVTYTLSLTRSAEPGQDTIASWTINWGEGTPQVVTGNPATITHTYAAAGPYIISATATDEDGAYPAGNTVNVAVADPPDTTPPAIVGAPTFIPAVPGTIRIRFTEDVSASLLPADLAFRLADTTTDLYAAAVAWDAATFTASFTLPAGLDPGRYTATLAAGAVADAAGNGLATPATLTFDFLPGDADLSRDVGLNDLLLLANHYGLTGVTWAEGDFDGDGSVGLNDLLILANHYGMSIPTAGSALDSAPPAPAESAAPAAPAAPTSAAPANSPAPAAQQQTSTDSIGSNAAGIPAGANAPTAVAQTPPTPIPTVPVASVAAAPSQARSGGRIAPSRPALAIPSTITPPARRATASAAFKTTAFPPNPPVQAGADAGQLGWSPATPTPVPAAKRKLAPANSLFSSVAIQPAKPSPKRQSARPH